MPGALRAAFGAPAVVELELVCLDGCDGPTDDLRVEVPEYCACMRACIHAPKCACVRAMEERNAVEGAGDESVQVKGAAAQEAGECECAGGRK